MNRAYTRGGHVNRYVGAAVYGATREEPRHRKVVTVVHAPHDGYPPGAEFGIIQARMTLFYGGFEPGTVLRYRGECAIVERGGKLSKQIFTLYDERKGA